ncbi:MAG: fluoride efflux transporter CrcB [Rhodospirillaceae bacterium]|nr:fluoride efflux transporter CrcB [Rhodospirillaceae bacterium]
MSLQMVLYVGLGGAIGAMARFLTMSAIGHYFHGTFPFGTFAVNVVGSFALGALLEIMALQWSPSPELRALMVVGVLGAFTTFSTFSMDLYYLLNRGEIMQGALYATGSVLLCVAGFWAGMSVFRSVLS